MKRHRKIKYKKVPTLYTQRKRKQRRIFNWNSTKRRKKVKEKRDQSTTGNYTKQNR